MVAAALTTIKPQATAARSNLTRLPLLPSHPGNATAPPRRVKSREVTSRYMSSTSSSTSASSSSSSAQSLTLKRCQSPAISRPASSAARMTQVSAAPGATKRSQSAQRRRSGTPRSNSNSVDLSGASSKAASFTATMTPTAAAPAAINRSRSSERRRSATPLSNSVDLRGASSKADGSEVTPAQKMLLTSVRSLSASFQGDSFSSQVSKAKPLLSRSPSPGTVRRGTPERRKPASIAATPATIEQHRWPGRLRAGNSLCRSVDITDEKRKLGGSNTGTVVRALQGAMILDPRSSLNGRLSSSNMSNAVPRKLAEINGKKNSGIGFNETSNLLSSDSEDGSSQGNSGAQREFRGGGGSECNIQRAPGGIVVPPRFMQETNNRLRQQTEPGSPLSKSGGLKNMVTTTKFIGQKKQYFDSPVSSPKGILNTRGQSPIHGAIRPTSPSNLASRAASSPRGMSPSRGRSSLGGTWADNNNVGSAPSILSFAVEIRKGKFRENRIVDAHAMRLLHNRLLQWRFANARADLALSAQQMNAERSLYTTWVSTTRLRESVQTKRFQLQLQRENLKLAAILRGEMIYLEQWPSIERDYSSSLAGATETLMASTIRLPISGARADIQKMKNAICSAVDVMQGMASSICLLLSKVGNVNSSVTELRNVVSKEQALLDQCQNLLSTCAALQVKEHNVRAHVLQLKCQPTSCTAKSRQLCCSVTST